MDRKRFNNNQSVNNRHAIALTRIFVTIGMLVSLFVAVFVPIGSRQSVQAQATDLFAGKSTRASSTYNSSPSSVVDGNDTSRWESSNTAVPRWWSVDIGEAAQLDSIRLVQSTSGSINNIVNFKLQGSNDDVAWDDLLSVTNASGGASNYSVGATVSYRLYRIYITQVVSTGVGTQVFTVEGYGTVDPAFSHSGSDTFRNGPTAAVNTYSSYWPGNAVDGNDATRWESNHLVMPRWWRVDTAQASRLSSLRVVQEATGGSSNILDFKLQGSNDDATWNDLLTVTNALGGTTNYTVTTTASYRLYRIYITRVVNTGASTRLYAVEGFGSLDPPFVHSGSDVFRNGPTAAVNTYSSYWPGNAVDGNDATRWESNHLVMPRWWRVDIGQKALLSSLRVVQEATGGSSNILDFKLQGSNDDATWDDLLTVTNALGGTTDYAVTSTTSYRLYRIYITRVVNTGASTRLYAVEGFGSLDPPFVHRGSDVFRNRATTAVTTCCSTQSGNAVDGNDATRWESNHLVMPRWWRVDTAQASRLSSLRVVQESTGGSSNILDFKLQGSNDDAAWNDLLTVTNALGGTTNYKVTTTVSYRFYRIYITRVVNTGASTRLYAVEGYDLSKGVAPHPMPQSYGGKDPDCDACAAEGRVADPINAATGNAYWEELDLRVDAPGLPFEWERTYNSRDERLGILGRGWSSTFDMRLALNVTGTVKIFTEGGAQAIYTSSGGQFVPPAGVLSTLRRNADGTYTFTRPDQSISVFSSAGQLLSKADSAGRTISLTYTSGKLSSITDSVGRTYTVGTDSQGRVTQLTDNSVQRTVAYTYTGDLLTQVRDLLGHESQYSYTNNLLTSITYSDSTIRVQNSYDSLSRAVWQDTWDTTPITITYDVVAPAITPTQILTRTILEDTAGRTSSYDHDAGGRLIRTVDPAGKSTIVGWDANDRPLAVADALGHASTRTFDLQGNLLSARDATGRGLDYVYDDFNRLVSEKDALGRTTTYSYTLAGLLRQTSDALDNKNTYTYTVVPLQGGRSTSLLTSNEDALGRVTRYEYNSLAQPVAITNTLGQALYFEYDAAGRLTRSIDPVGIASCNEYDAANNLTATLANCVAGQSSTISRNVRTEYGYDILGRGIWTRTSLGEVSRTFYNEKGQVSKVVVGCAVSGTPSTDTCDTYDAAHPELNRTTTYGYDDLGRQVTATDTLDVVSRTEYDTLDRPTGYTLNYLLGQPANPVTNITATIEYDAAGQVSASLDALGRRSVPHYDNAGRMIEQITNYVDGNPSTGTADTDLVSRTEYDTVGLPVTTTLNYVDGVWDSAHPDQDLRSVTRYDELGRTSKVIENYVDGVSATNEVDTDRITEYRYDAVGNLVATIDPLGRVDVTIYDALNRPATQVRNCTDSNGQPSTVSTNCATGHGTNNDENIRTSTNYDVRGQVETSHDALNRIVHTDYDPLGRVTEHVLNESGSYVPTNVQYQYAYTYTTLGYTVVVTNPLQGVTKSEYNRAGWLVQQTDATNRTVTYSYDGLGRVVASTDALGHQTRSVYDALGRGTKDIANWQNGTVDTADGTDRDLITETVYDAAGRRVAQVAADGKRTNFNYDQLDRLTSVVENASGATSPASVTTSYGYNRLGLLTGITDALQHGRSFSYNAAGWKTGETDGLNRQTTYTYDKAGRTKTVADPRPVTVTYGYDKADRLVSTTATGLTSISMQYDVAGRRISLQDETGTTTYSYNGLDNLTQAAHSVDGTVAYGYDLLGRRTSLTSSHTGAPYIAYEYDAAGRLEDVKQATGSGQPQTLVAHADYDAVGRLQEIERANGVDTTYSYDNANRLSSLTAVQGNTTLTDFDYTLNRLGQVTTSVETIGQASRTITYTYDGLQRLSAAAESPGTTYGYTYDLVGNRTQVTKNSNVTESRTYDAADQISNTGWQYDGAGNLLADGTNTYTYDALRRLSSVTASGTTTSTLYTYNGDGVLASDAVGTNQTKYVLDTIGGLPERLGSISGSTISWYVRGWGQELNRQVGSTTQWYLADRLGSVRATLDNSAAILGNYNYDPYGTPEGTSIPQDYGFTGEPHDSVTGLVHLRARWYNTKTSGFQSMDPFNGWLERPKSLHPYLYVYSDPTNGVDPTGLTCEYGDAVNGKCTPNRSSVRCEGWGGACTDGSRMSDLKVNSDPLFAAGLGIAAGLRTVGDAWMWLGDRISVASKAWVETVSEFDSLCPIIPCSWAIAGGKTAKGAVSARPYTTTSQAKVSKPNVNSKGNKNNTNLGQGKVAKGSNSTASAGACRNLREPSSTRLNKSLGGPAHDKMDAHHLIPAERYAHPFVLRAWRAGWDHDAAYNGILLPENDALSARLGLPAHVNNHPKYSGFVLKVLNVLEDLAVTHKWSDARANAELKSVAAQLKQTFSNVGGGVQLP